MKRFDELGLGRWFPVLGMSALAVVAALSFERVVAESGTVSTRAHQPVSTEAQPAAGAATEALGLFRYGQIPQSLRVLPPVTVDYRNDEGTRARQSGVPLAIGAKQRPSRGSTAGGAILCDFDIECNDCNLCTVDTCSENVCLGGQRDGFGCEEDVDCEGICDGGVNPGGRCAGDADCPNNSNVELPGECILGTDAGDCCEENADCDSGDCEINTDHIFSGVCILNTCEPLVGGQQCVFAAIPFVCKDPR